MDPKGRLSNKILVASCMHFLYIIIILANQSFGTIIFFCILSMHGCDYSSMGMPLMNIIFGLSYFPLVCACIKISQ